MDLRVKKTLKSIDNAFFELRKKKTIEKISVRELSEHAMINKATFYLHYRDIYDLAETLEEKLIDSIIDEIKHLRLRYSKTETRLLAETLSRAIILHREEIETLYGTGNNRFVYRLEDRLKHYIFTNSDSIRNTPEMNIILTFMIQGSYHAHIRNSNIDAETLRRTTSELFMKIVD